MENSFKVLGLGGLILGMLVAGGCGGGGGDSFNFPTTGKGTVTTPAPTDQATTVTTGGSDDASRGNVTYTLQGGEYTYAISNFAAGDKLVFPAGNPPSVDNQSFTDGTIKISCTTTAGAIVNVELQKLSTAQDKVVSVSDINTIFGAGTITQQ
jgi:hypothetical protein